MKLLNKILLIGSDHELALSKVTIVKVDKNFLHLDKLPDSSWRMTFNRNLTPDFKKVNAISFQRDGKGRIVTATLEGTDQQLNIVKCAGVFRYDTIQLEEAAGGWNIRFSKELFPDFDNVSALSFERVEIE